MQLFSLTTFTITLLASTVTAAFAGAPCRQFLQNGGNQLNNGSCIDDARATNTYALMLTDANVKDALATEDAQLVARSSMEFRVGPFLPGQIVQLGSLCHFYFHNRQMPNFFVTHVDLTDATRKKLLPLFSGLKLDREYGDNVVCEHLAGGVACYQSTYGLAYQCE